MKENTIYSELNHTKISKDCDFISGSSFKIDIGSGQQVQCVIVTV